MIHDKGTRPEARESTAKRRESLKRVVRDSTEIAGQIDFLFISGSGGGGVGFDLDDGSSEKSSSSESSPSASTESS